MIINNLRLNVLYKSGKVSVVVYRTRDYDLDCDEDLFCLDEFLIYLAGSINDESRVLLAATGWLDEVAIMSYTDQDILAFSYCGKTES